MTEELDIRGTSAKTLREYLVRLGGEVHGPAYVTGPGWEVRLTVSTHRFGEWEMPRVLLRFEGDPTMVQEITKRFRIMAWRGGG